MIMKLRYFNNVSAVNSLLVLGLMEFGISVMEFVIELMEFAIYLHPLGL